MQEMRTYKEAEEAGRVAGLQLLVLGVQGLLLGLQVPLLLLQLRLELPELGVPCPQLSRLTLRDSRPCDHLAGCLCLQQACSVC